MKKVIKFIIYIFSPIVLGAIISFIVGFKSYGDMLKPPLSPPAIVFPIVWSILYLIMGISFYLVNKDELNSVKYYIIQLVLNLLWSILFFKFKLYIISAIWIVALEYFVIQMIVDFKKYNKKAAYLQIPYFIWLLVALYLNIGVALLN